MARLFASSTSRRTVSASGKQLRISSSSIPPMPLALKGRQHVELVQHDGLAVSARYREGHAGDRLAVIGHQELGVGSCQPPAQRRHRMPASVIAVTRSTP